jgi:hypothetical protein
MQNDHLRLVDAPGFSSQLLLLTRFPGVRVPQEWPIDLQALLHQRLTQVSSPGFLNLIIESRISLAANTNE